MTQHGIHSTRGGRGLSGRLHHLKMLHERIQARIDAEAARPNPDVLILQSLKRQKLKTKDEIALVSGMIQNITRQQTASAA